MQTHGHRPTLIADPDYPNHLVRVCFDCGVPMERATR
jgi:hypothetical protein